MRKMKHLAIIFLIVDIFMAAALSLLIKCSRDEYSEDDFSASADEAYSVEERYADYGDEPDEACSFSDDELLGGSGWF